MADIHLFQWLLAFGAALWLTERWMLTQPTQRWRHIAAGIVSTILWIPVAYTAGNVHTTAGTTTTVFGSDALGTFAMFMIVVNLLGLVVGLVLWVEEQADDAEQAMAVEMRPTRGDD